MNDLDSIYERFIKCYEKKRKPAGMVDWGGGGSEKWEKWEVVGEITKICFI